MLHAYCEFCEPRFIATSVMQRAITVKHTITYSNIVISNIWIEILVMGLIHMHTSLS